MCGRESKVIDTSKHIQGRECNEEENQLFKCLKGLKIRNALTISERLLEASELLQKNFQLTSLKGDIFHHQALDLSQLTLDQSQYASIAQMNPQHLNDWATRLL